MNYENISLVIENNQIYTRIVFNKGINNLITEKFIEELNNALDIAIKFETKVIILEGTDNVFCNGLSFKDIDGNKNKYQKLAVAYSELLNRIMNLPQIVVSKVNGNVSAGGLGIIAVSDYAIAKKNVNFCLSELIWGLLPATIAPFLMKKIGYTVFKQMAFTGKAYKAEEALSIGLVNSVNDNIDFEIKKNFNKVGYYTNDVIGKFKEMINKLFPISEQQRQIGVECIVSRIDDEVVKSNISNYVNSGKFPWESKSN